MLIFEAKSRKQELREITQYARNPAKSIADKIASKIDLQCEKAAKGRGNWTNVTYNVTDVEDMCVAYEVGEELQHRLLEMGFETEDFTIRILPIQQVGSGKMGFAVKAKISWE